MQEPNAAECLESGGALAVHVRVTRCPPLAGGVEGTIEAFSGGQLGFEPAPGELFAWACTCLIASLRLRACSSLWAGDGFAAVRHPVPLIGIVLAIAMATKVKKTEGLHLVRIRSGKRDFMPRNGRCARIPFLFRTLARVAQLRKSCSLIPVQDPQYKEHAAEANGKKDDSPLMMEFSRQIRRIHTRPQYPYRKNAQAVFGYGNRNGKNDREPFSPRRAQQELRQNHRRHQQQRARTDAAALLGNLQGEAWNVEQNAVLSHRHAGEGEHGMRCKGRRVLQPSHNLIQQKPRQGHHQEQKAEGKEQSSGKLSAETENERAYPPCDQGQHVGGKLLIRKQIRVPSCEARDQEGKAQQKRPGT